MSFPIAEHLSKIEAVRWLAYHALELRDAGRPHTAEAAMVKWMAPRFAVEAIHECIVLHGHRGYSDELPLMQMEADVSGLEIGDGTPQIQKHIIAREAYGRGVVGRSGAV